MNRNWVFWHLVIVAARYNYIDCFRKMDLNEVSPSKRYFLTNCILVLLILLSKSSIFCPPDSYVDIKILLLTLSVLPFRFLLLHGNNCVRFAGAEISLITLENPPNAKHFGPCQNTVLGIHFKCIADNRQF